MKTVFRRFLKIINVQNKLPMIFFSDLAYNKLSKVKHTRNEYLTFNIYYTLNLKETEIGKYILTYF